MVQELAYQRQTSSAYLLTRLLGGPFWALFYLLPVILYKDLHASAMQITLLVALKPMVALISLYWSSPLHQRQDRLISNLVWANILKYLPFLLFPFVDNVWYFVFSFGFYMMFVRGVIPAWMEVLKLNIPEEERSKLFTYSAIFDYIGGAAFPLLMGWLFDDYPQAWRWIFAGTAVIGIISTFFIYRLPMVERTSESATPLSLTLPWKQAWQLVKARPDFMKFQIGFMLGGAGLMLMQPALPKFFVDVLNLSYTELAIALSICKSIGYVVASPAWMKMFPKMNIYRFCSFVTFLCALFPLLLIPSQFQLVWLYAAYMTYGVMQAGSELGWHMSGPIFAKNEDSSLYSSVNVVTVGLRGCVAPVLGGILCEYIPSTSILILGCLLCAFATERMLRYSFNTEPERDTMLGAS